MITIKSLAREYIETKEDNYISSIRVRGDSDEDFIYCKEITNHKPLEEGFDGASFCFFHDFGEHSGRYQRVFENFISGFSTPARILLIDFRGHGKSSGTRGHISSLDEICNDSISILNIWNKGHSGLTSMIGFGLGGIVSLKILHLFFSRLDFKISGLVLLNPGLKWKWKIPEILENIMISGISKLSKVKLPFEIDGPLFAGDSVNAQEFDADPLISHTMTLGTFFEVQKSAHVTRTSAYYLDLPVFIGISGEDRLYDNKVTELFARGISDCQLSHYKKSYHDLLHYFENEKVTKDVYNWFVKHVSVIE